MFFFLFSPCCGNEFEAKLKFTAPAFDIGLGQLFEDFTQILFHNQIIDLNAASEL